MSRWHPAGFEIRLNKNLVGSMNLVTTVMAEGVLSSAPGGVSARLTKLSGESCTSSTLSWQRVPCRGTRGMSTPLVKTEVGSGFCPRPGEDHLDRWCETHRYQQVLGERATSLPLGMAVGVLSSAPGGGSSRLTKLSVDCRTTHQTATICRGCLGAHCLHSRVRSSDHLVLAPLKPGSSGC